MSKKITDRQKEILEFIRQFVNETGYPPTVREIANHFGLSSTFGVQRHIEALQKKGYLAKGTNTSRGLSLVKGATPEHEPYVHIPVVGRVAAGMPITSYENIDGNLLVDKNFLNHRDQHFALKVKGDSMIEDGIFEGDYVIVSPEKDPRNDEIVVASIEGDVTVKRFMRATDHIELLPSNAKYKPITIQNTESFDIIGKVVGVMRWLA